MDEIGSQLYKKMSELEICRFAKDPTVEMSRGKREIDSVLEVDGT